MVTENTMNGRIFILLLLALAIVAGCDSLFDVHPYDANFDGETDINNHNMRRIEDDCRDKLPLHVAFISDTHIDYADLRAMVDDINRRDSIDFVIHLGDLSDTGTTKEFVWTRERLSALRKPYVALIGNHDFLGTGEEVYVRMFGKFDFSFIAGRVKFLCLNTNATEYDYIAAVPNFDFMEEHWTADSALYDRTIVCMHARPYSDQFNNNVAKSFEYYINMMRGTMFCINGHDHSQKADDIYGDGVMYYGVDAAYNRNYMLFTIGKEGYSYEIVRF